MSFKFGKSDAEKESNGNKASDFPTINMIKPEKNIELPLSEVDEEDVSENNVNQMIRRSIIAKNPKRIVKNSISCMDLEKAELISQKEVDSDMSNLKGLKKKLAIIEEKEKQKKAEKKIIKRKNKVKPRVKKGVDEKEKEKTVINLTKTSNKINENTEHNTKESQETESLNIKDQTIIENKSINLKNSEDESIESSDMDNVFHILSKCFNPR
jgi:hypothetical protein